MSITISSPRLNARSVASTIGIGGETASINLPIWGAKSVTAGTLGVTLTVDEGTVGNEYAPHRCSFDLAVTGFDGESDQTEYWRADTHRVWYLHNFGDFGARFTVADRIEGEHKDRNVAVGQQAVHVYRAAGSYFYYVFCYDRAGNWGSASQVITVKEDDYTADETVIIAHDGDFSGAPYATPRNRLTSLTEFDDWSPVAGVTRLKVWMKRGGIYPESANGMMTKPETITMVGYGPGEKPQINIATRIFHNMPVLKVQGIKFYGGWNANTEMPDDPSVSPIGFNPGIYFSGLTFEALFDDCEDDGTAAAFYPSTDDGYMCLHEQKRTNHKDFMFFGAIRNGTAAIVGCSEVQVPDALNGGQDRGALKDDGPRVYLRNAHQGIRAADVFNIIITNCDFFSRQGWTLQNIFLDNPVFRLNTGVESYTPGRRISVNRCHIEGSIADTNLAYKQYPANCMMEQCRFVFDPTAQVGMQLEHMGWTVRDNILILADTPATPYKGPSPYVFKVGSDDLPADVASEWDTRTEIYSNTIVDLRSQANAPSTLDLVVPARTGVQAPSGNNLFYRPNIDTPQIADGPLDLTGLGFEVRYAGVRLGFHDWSDHYTLAADLLDGSDIVVPYGVGWDGQTTEQADFAGAWTRNGVRFKFSPADENDVLYDQMRGGADFAFEAGGIRITNTSGVTWPSGAVLRVIVDRGSTAMAMDTTWAIPAGTMRRYGITASSGAYQNASGPLVSLSDFHGRWRPGTAHPDAAAGTPSVGATELVT